MICINAVTLPLNLPFTGPSGYSGRERPAERCNGLFAAGITGGGGAPLAAGSFSASSAGFSAKFGKVLRRTVEARAAGGE